MSTPQPSRLRRLFGRKSSTSSEAMAQDWLPIRDIREGCLIRNDGAVMGGIAIAPLNLALKSMRETRAIITTVYSSLNSLTVPWQIISQFRPVDLDGYLTQIHETLHTVDARRQAFLRPYLEWLHSQIDSGEGMQRWYYLILERRGEDAEAVHRHSLPGMAADWNRIRGMRATPMDDDMWKRLVFSFFHPQEIQSEALPTGTFAVPPVTDISPVRLLNGPKEKGEHDVESEASDELPQTSGKS